MTTSLVAIPLLIARSLRVAIHKDWALLHRVSRIQFFIRHLLVLMIVVAGMMSVGQLIRNHLVSLAVGRCKAGRIGRGKRFRR